jgi:hypothetical protein
LGGGLAGRRFGFARQRRAEPANRPDGGVGRVIAGVSALASAA